MNIRFCHFAAQGAGAMFAVAVVTSMSAYGGISVGGAQHVATVSSIEANGNGQAAHVTNVKYDVPNCMHHFP